MAALASPEPETLLARRDNGTCLLTMNRPRALNALNHGMVTDMAAALDEAASDAAVQAVVIAGAGDRAYCAGGDVKTVALRDDRDLERAFFGDEYRLNMSLSAFPKASVALIKGITMGGGVGVSVHGRYRVASQSTLFAMPETAIGFFPDVGATHILSHLPLEPPEAAAAIGLYLALTGNRLQASDCLYLGLATHYVPPAQWGAMEEALGSADVGADGEQLESVLAQFDDRSGLEAPSIVEVQQRIVGVFGTGQPTVEEMMQRLERLSTTWARDTFETLQKRCPTSLVVTAAALRRAATMTLAEALQMEFRVALNLVQQHDFKEGIRAALVDKDHAPRWSPATLAEVGDVEWAFAPQQGVPDPLPMPRL